MPALGFLFCLIVLALLVATIPVLWPLLLLLLPAIGLVLWLTVGIVLPSWLGPRMRRAGLSDRQWDALAVGLGLVLLAGIAGLASR